LHNIEFEINGKELHIKDYPNAIKVARIDSPKSVELRNLVLHMHDLQLAFDFLNLINSTKDEKIRTGLWYVSVTLYFKCFTNSLARKMLSPSKVYKECKDALPAFNYFKALRDKHLVHDENAYAQAFVGLVVNSPGSECKIADVLSGTIISETLDQSHWSSFYNLVKYALEWVGKRREDLHFALAKEYEKLEYEEIINLENVNFTVPTTDKAFKSRNL